MTSMGSPVGTITGSRLEGVEQHADGTSMTIPAADARLSRATCTVKKRHDQTDNERNEESGEFDHRFTWRRPEAR